MLQAETDHAVESRQLSHAWYDQTLSERNIHPQADRGVPHYADGEWSRYLIGVAAIVRKGARLVDHIFARRRWSGCLSTGTSGSQTTREESQIGRSARVVGWWQQCLQLALSDGNLP